MPRLISWNLTFKCNLKCAHCYINANEGKGGEELSTEEGMMLIDQIAEVAKPTLILSGGEPLLREDVFELARYASKRGFKVTMGTNGTLLGDRVAKRLKSSGVRKIAISLDSSMPEKHDEFRGVKGSWERAVEGIRACRRNGIDVQINTTITQRNYNEIAGILDLAERLGAKDLHAFFLVPTGRGKGLEKAPAAYEKMLVTILKEGMKHKINVKPTCAPQFARLVKQMGFKPRRRWSRGCIAGLSYCRVYPTGDVTPCPYLPISLGNVRERSFKEIWFDSKVLKALRDFNNLKGRCGACEYRDVCGGCRARAYGLTSSAIGVCDGLHEPTGLKGDYLAEDPWCAYRPKALGEEKIG